MILFNAAEERRTKLNIVLGIETIAVDVTLGHSFHWFDVAHDQRGDVHQIDANIKESTSTKTLLRISRHMRRCHDAERALQRLNFSNSAVVEEF